METSKVLLPGSSLAWSMLPVTREAASLTAAISGIEREDTGEGASSAYAIVQDSVTGTVASKLSEIVEVDARVKIRMAEQLVTDLQALGRLSLFPCVCPEMTLLRAGVEHSDLEVIVMPLSVHAAMLCRATIPLFPMAVMPPEVIQKKLEWGETATVWSVGMTLREVFGDGSRVFPATVTHHEIADRLCAKPFPTFPSPLRCPAALTALLDSCNAPNAADRPSLDHLLRGLHDVQALVQREGVVPPPPPPQTAAPAPRIPSPSPPQTQAAGSTHDEALPGPAPIASPTPSKPSSRSRLLFDAAMAELMSGGEEEAAPKLLELGETLRDAPASDLRLSPDEVLNLLTSACSMTLLEVFEMVAGILCRVRASVRAALRDSDQHRRAVCELVEATAIMPSPSAWRLAGLLFKGDPALLVQAMDEHNLISTLVTALTHDTGDERYFQVVLRVTMSAFDTPAIRAALSAEPLLLAQLVAVLTRESSSGQTVQCVCKLLSMMCSTHAPVASVLVEGMGLRTLFAVLHKHASSTDTCIRIISTLISILQASDQHAAAIMELDVINAVGLVVSTHSSTPFARREDGRRCKDLFLRAMLLLHHILRSHPVVTEEQAVLISLAASGVAARNLEHGDIQAEVAGVMESFLRCEGAVSFVADLDRVVDSPNPLVWLQAARLQHQDCVPVLRRLWGFLACLSSFDEGAVLLLDRQRDIEQAAASLFPGAPPARKALDADVLDVPHIMARVLEALELHGGDEAEGLHRQVFGTLYGLVRAPETYANRVTAAAFNLGDGALVTHVIRGLQTFKDTVLHQRCCFIINVFANQMFSTECRNALVSRGAISAIAAVVTPESVSDLLLKQESPAYRLLLDAVRALAAIHKACPAAVHATPVPTYIDTLLLALSTDEAVTRPLRQAAATFQRALQTID